MRIKLHLVGDVDRPEAAIPIELDPELIIFLGPSNRGSYTALSLDSSRCNEGHMLATETVAEIRALEEAAKNPPNEADEIFFKAMEERKVAGKANPALEWRKYFPWPWQVVHLPAPMVGAVIQDAHGVIILRHAQNISPDSGMALAMRHMVACVNKCEAEASA